MSFFSGIGDFFRGAFGEDDEEKRRRKERERQESQKRAQSKQKSTSNYSPKRSNSYFNNNVKSSPNPFGVPMNAPKPEVNKVDFPAPSLDAKKSLAPKQSFLNKLIDRVDANTESDKFRREQEGKARDYRQSQRDAGEKDYTNPFQRVGFEFVERPIKALNTVGSAAVGIKDQTENLNDLIKIKLAYSRGKISKDDYEKMSEAVSNRNSEARFGGKGGILGVGSFYDDVDELEDKKKLASTILQTGGELSQFLPQGKAFEAGLKASGEFLAAKKLLQKEVYENVAGGFASNAGEQVEQGKLDLKGLLVGATIDGLSPIALKKFGGGLSHLKKSGAGDETLERVVKKVRDARTPEEAERLINSLDEIRAKRDGPHIKMGMQDSYTQKQLDAHFSTPAPQVGKTVDPLEALKQEARKYKSADTFAMNINDKEIGDNLVVYKGTGGDLDMGGARGFDYLKKVGDSQKDMPKNTSSFSQDKFFARQYGDVTPYAVPKKDIMPKEQYSKLIGEATGVGDNSGTALRGMWRRSDKYPSVIPDVKKAGYKGFTDVNGEIVMFDRSSLTDLYNQAHAKHQAPEAPKAQAPDPTAALKQEARKYETAKEFALVHSNEKQRLRLDDLSAVETSDKSVDWGFDQRKAPPIIVDQHGQILDGHHRYYAAKEAFEKDAELYNEGKVNHIYMEQKWGDVNFGEIDAVVKNKENLGKGWAQEKKSDNLTYDQLTDLYNQATQSQPPKSPIESLKDATPNSTVVRDIERGLDNAIPAPSNATHNLDAARERISKQIEDINNITRSHVEGIQRTPTLSIKNKTKLIEEVANKYRAVRAELDNTLAKTTSQVDEAGKAIDTAQTARQEVIGEVQQAKAATPEVGVKATPTPEPATVAEVNVNNAYQPGDNAFKGVDATQTTSDLLDDLLTRGGDDIDRQDRSSVLGKLFGAIPKTTQKVTNPMSDLTNKVLTAASNSGNGITSRAAQAPRGVWSRFGMGDASRAALDSVSGLKNTSRSVGLRIARRRNETVKKLIEQGAEPSDITRLLHQVFETPEFLARKYGDDVAKLSPDKLPPALRQIVDEQIELNKVRNQINFDTGIIDEKAYFQGQDGMHTPRVYGFDFAAKNANGGALDSTYNNFDTTAGVRRNELSDVPDEIFDTVVDPLTAQDIRFQQALVNKSRMDAIQNIQSEFRVFDKAPNNGFSRLEGKQFGPLDGKFVDSQVATTLNGSPIFKTDLGSRANDLLDVYRDSPLGKADRLIKQTKTVGAVGTHVGNIGGNVTLFSTGAGVDPATALARGIGGARSLISDARGGLDPEVYYLRKLGIIGDDTGRAINGIAQKDVIKVESLLTEAENLARKNPNKAARLFSGAWGKLQDIYGGTDDAFKLGIFRELKSRGYKDDLAARLIREQFQNYGNVGRGVGMLADSPVLGKPFARFIPELGRITKNTVKNNPVGAAASIGGLSYASNKLSEMSGETEEERDRRENAVGQTKVPLTSGINKLFGGKGDVSLNFALPGDTSVNVARSVGLNFPIEPNSDASSAVVNQLNPFSLPTRTDKGGHTVFAPEEGVSSMALNPIARLIANRDFMGRRITDPDNPVRWEGNGQTRYKYENPDGSPMDDTKNSNYNRGKSLLMSYLPFSSEIDAGLSSVGGKEDYYGKNRTPPQAIARMFGFKTEDNSQGNRDKKAKQSKYFEDKLPATQKFLDENPDLSDAYWELKNTARDRNTEISQNDQVSPERYKVIASDKSGRLFNFLKAQAIATAKEKGTQVDPLYTLLPEEANQVIALKAMYTGDDTKFQQLLYKQPWYTAYKDADRAYQSQKPESGSFPGSALPNARPTEWYGLSEQLNDPDKGIVANYPLVQKYKAEINKFVDYDSDERKAFTKNWYANYGDAYTAQSDAFKSAQLDLVNKMRAIEGAPPLTPEIWAGRFETDDAKSYGSGSGGGYSRGYGGGGGGGSSSRQNDTNKLNNIANTTVSSPLDYIQPKDMPAIQALLRKLEAGGGGRKATPKLGAASRGTG